MYKSASFSAAATAIQVVAPKAYQSISVTRISVYVSHACTVDVSASVSIGSQVVTSHPGIAAGSGFVETGTRDTPLATGNPGESLTFTCSVPTTGSAVINVTYDIAPA